MFSAVSPSLGSTTLSQSKALPTPRAMLSPSLPAGGGNLGAKPAGLAGNVELDELQQRRFGVRIGFTKGISALPRSAFAQTFVKLDKVRSLIAFLDATALGSMAICPIGLWFFEIQNLQVCRHVVSAGL